MLKRILSCAIAVFLQIMSACDGQAAEEAKYDIKWAYHNGLAQFIKDGKVGLMNEAGEVVLPAQYDAIDPQSPRAYHGAFEIRQGKKVGLAGKNGEVLTPAIWDSISYMDEHYVVIENGLYGLLGLDGEIMIEPQYWFLGRGAEGRLVYALTWEESETRGLMNVEGDIYVGLMDYEGKRITPPDWFDLWYVQDGLVVAADAEHNDRFIDLNGNMVMDAHGYGIETNFINGYAVIYQWIKASDAGIEAGGAAEFKIHGVMDRNGNITAEPRWQGGDLNEFGLMEVYDMHVDRYGLIDVNGDFVIPFIAITGISYHDGVYVVQTEERLWQCYSPKGQLLFEIECEETREGINGLLYHDGVLVVRAKERL